MIVVSGVIEIAAADMERAKTAATEVAVATRGEAGCLAYAFYQDVESPTVFRVFEEWESAEALAAHFETDHMLRFRALMGGFTITGRNITRYNISSFEPLG